ncbi:MAG: hypothetical protein IKV62_03010 [Bacteroidales bacterium]|nr:hypothetical protein [Bacteroidales bacterium]
MEKVLETDKILNYIDEAVGAFPSIKVVVLTGGECFLIASELPQIIARIKSYNLISRVVSNGFWATSYDAAVKKLTPLVEAGLTEINISTGDNHQEYVPFENVVNGFKAAYDLGIRSMAVSVESPPNAKFTSETIKNHPFLSSLLDDGTLYLLDAAWMRFSTGDNVYEGAKSFLIENFDTHKPCKNIYDNIVINPYSQLLACCGLSVEYNKYLKLGEIGNNNSISDLYYSQFSDLFKFWLHVDGPAVIYDKIAEIRGMEKKSFPHECQYCIELVSDKDNHEIIRELLKTELPSILFRHSLRQASFKFTK